MSVLFYLVLVALAFLCVVSAHEMSLYGTGHPWMRIDGVAPDKPLDSAVLTRLKQFSAMNKLKKMALRVSYLLFFS